MGGALFSPVSGLCLPTLCCMRVIRSLQTRRGNFKSFWIFAGPELLPGADSAPRKLSQGTWGPMTGT